MIKKVFLCFSIVLFLVSNAYAQTAKSAWVDSVHATLSLEEKIGQLMMIPVGADKSSDLEKAEDLIKNQHIGGIIFTHGGPVQQARLTNHFQRIAPVPLFVGQEAEWGLGMILDSAISFPRALILGAVRDNNLIYESGKEIARQMSILGVHINFAPVAELNADPSNAISYRSFGSNKINVAEKTVAFMRGMQDNNVLACAKNFPVNGLTIMDIQKGLPVITPYIDSTKAYPFKKLFENGLTGVVAAPADLPLFYQDKNLVRKNKFGSKALTSIFMAEWLKKQMHFEGLLFVDIKEIQSSTNKYRSGEAEMFAFQAGNDILLSPVNIGAAVRKIKKLIKKNKPYATQLDNSVKKILAIKYTAGLNTNRPVNLDNLISRLNTPQAMVLKQKLFGKAITLIKNEQNTVPIRALDNRHFTFITCSNESADKDFYQYLSKYVDAAYYTTDEKTDFPELLKSLRDQDVIIAGIFPQTPEESLAKLIPFLKELSATKDVIICDFGRINFLKEASNFSTFITAYVNAPEMLQLVPQAIFGGISTTGQLPFSPSPEVPEGIGIITPSINRLSYSIPEDAGMDSETLNKIEHIANEAIAMGATPGCHVLVAKRGKVIYEKSFGFLTYDNKTPVSDETIYDLASVTKVSVTLQAVMFLQEKGLIDINRKISSYLPELKNSNKKDFTIKDILTHQAGLWPFLPFWAQTMKDSTYLPEFYSRVKNETYPLMVAENLFASKAMKDSLWTWIIKAKVRDKAARTPYDYRYSDMGFYILQHLAEKLLNQPIEDFIQQNLFEPLGSSTTGYVPLERFPASQIAPTENDRLFRKSLLIGTVHDQGAAMLGGIAGHAGLFSNANDLAKLGQMLLQNGTYGDNRFYKPETVRMFTQRQFDTSRRGLGWDKPTISDWNGPTSLYASPKTFGHTGFTGTCIWVDPEFDLVYVFLSNRVYPSMTNNKLINANIRPRIQDVIYESIFKYCQYYP
jgi:CubicO group peptidase (beta-lactamase class C family)/beta-glucosidase-like glycosyl hydrolase